MVARNLLLLRRAALLITRPVLPVFARRLGTRGCWYSLEKVHVRHHHVLVWVSVSSRSPNILFGLVSLIPHCPSLGYITLLGVSSTIFPAPIPYTRILLPGTIPASEGHLPNCGKLRWCIPVLVLLWSAAKYNLQCLLCLCPSTMFLWPCSKAKLLWATGLRWGCFSWYATLLTYFTTTLRVIGLLTRALLWGSRSFSVCPFCWSWGYLVTFWAQLIELPTLATIKFTLHCI